MTDRHGRVAIISREGNDKSLDIRMLEAELKRRGIEVRTLTKLLTKERSLKNAAGYAGHIAAQCAAIAWADVVVVDTYIIPVSMLPHSSRTKVVQMWHALSAVKKFGWQTAGRPDGTSLRTAELMRMHRGYDYVLAPSCATARCFAEAFRADMSRIVKKGLPRIDYILNVTQGTGRELALARIYSKYPALRAAGPGIRPEAGKPGRRIVLYAPTFRRGSMPDVKGLADALDPEKYTLAVKLHPLYKTEAELPKADNIIYDYSIPAYDLMAAADAIVSDYSSLVVEATLADKPLYLYTYDIDSYSETTGLNMDFDAEAIGRYVFRDAGSLAEALEDSIGSYDMDALHAFRDKYIEVDKDNCTGQLADFIEELL